MCEAGRDLLEWLDKHVPFERAREGNGGCRRSHGMREVECLGVEISLKSRWKGAEGNTQELTVNGLMLLWEGGDCVRVRVGCEMKL